MKTNEYDARYNELGNVIKNIIQEIERNHERRMLEIEANNDKLEKYLTRVMYQVEDMRERQERIIRAFPELFNE